MQIIRLMARPDKVIGFDELPYDLIKDIELCDESKMPRHWRDFIGLRERTIQIKPYMDTMLNRMVSAPPIKETRPFTYLLDRTINKDKEIWALITSYVRRNTPREFRLLDNLEDMAKPLAVDVHSEISLEPEDMIIIPLIKQEEEPESYKTTVSETKDDVHLCEICSKEFDSKKAVRMHKMKKHSAVHA